MNWIRLTKNDSAVQVYNLLEGKITREVLRYHPLQQSARLNCNGLQRVFFVEPQGFRNTQFTIKNEYGFYEGKISISDITTTEEAGWIEYEQHKIQFTFFHNSAASELVIYKSDGLRPLAVCGLATDADEKTAPLFINKSFHALYAGLVWSFYWYLVSNGENETKQLLPQNNKYALEV